MHSFDLLLAAAIAGSATAAVYGQTDNWQIDSAHSTASFTLTSSSKTDRLYNLAIAKVAGRLDVDAGNPTDTVLKLNIYPAGQGSNLLGQDGAFRSATLGTLTKYTLMTFQSERAFVTPDGKLAVEGRLTALHVQRRVSITWGDDYTGPVYSDPIVDRFVGEAIFTLDIPAAMLTKGQNPNAEAVSASTVIKRADFPGLWSALRGSEWPVVVLDKNCVMPYYPGPSLRDYKGPACTGTPVLAAPHEEQQPTPPGTEGVGSIAPVPPIGDQIAIEVHIQLSRAGADLSWRPRN